MSEEMICKNCKYHYIEEISFDYPQSCCRKASGTTEQWCKCNNFEYGDRYIEQLQQENKELHNKIDKAIEILKEHFLEEWVRSSDTSDATGRMEIDTEHWTYKAYEILKDSDVDE